MYDPLQHDGLDELRERARELAMQRPQFLARKVLRLARIAKGAMLSSIVLLFVALVFLAYLIEHYEGMLRILAILAALPTLSAFAYLFHAMFLQNYDEQAEFELTQKNAPHLLRVVQQVRGKLGARALSAVYLVPELNASMTLNRRGFGWSKDCYTLELGLPLLLCCSAEEITAIIGHEFGHYLHGDNEVSNEVYATRQKWLMASARLIEADNVLIKPVLAFLQWFVPRLDALSYPLSQAQEFSADQAGARVTSAKIKSDALYRVQRASAYYHSHVEAGLWHDSEIASSLAHQRLQSMIERLRNPPICSASEQQALLTRTAPEDTHPSILDRLRALGTTMAPCDDYALTPLGKSAAESYFGADLPKLIYQFGVHYFGDAPFAGSNSPAHEQLPKQSVAESVGADVPADSAPEASATQQLALARSMMQSDPHRANQLLRQAAKANFFVAPHAIRSMLELMDLHGQTQQKNAALAALEKAESRVEQWQDAVDTFQATRRNLDSAELTALERSTLLVKLRSHKAIKHVWIASTRLAGFEQMQHLLIVCESSALYFDVDAVMQLVQPIISAEHTFDVFDSVDLGEDALDHLQAMPRAKLY